MRLSVTKHTARNHAAAPWLVIVPRRISATGKRQFHYFPTRSAAERFAASIRKFVRQHGERPLTPSAHDLADARMAEAILEGSGFTLVQAALLASQLLGNAVGDGTGAGDDAVARVGAVAGQGAHPLARRVMKQPTLASVLKDMLASKAHQSPHTRRTRSTRFNTFFRRNAGLARMPLSLISAREVERALDRAWANAPTSWNTMLTHLSALFNYAVRKGLVAANPLVAIDRKHVEEREIRPLSPVSLRALLQACRPPTPDELAAGREWAVDTTELAPYIAISAFAGIRPTEALRLRWGDINLEDGCISVRRTASKTGGTRHVELHPTLRAWLEPLEPEARPPQELIFRAGSPFTRRLREVRRRAGFDARNPWPEDVLRHSYASYYLKSGGSLERLQLNMGHASSALIYARYCNMYGLTRGMAEEWWGMGPGVVRGRGGCFQGRRA